MATRLNTTEQTHGLGAWFDYALSLFKARSQMDKDYAETVRQLNALSDRELDDIGLGRWQIRDVARTSTIDRVTAYDLNR